MDGLAPLGEPLGVKLSLDRDKLLAVALKGDASAGE